MLLAIKRLRTNGSAGASRVQVDGGNAMASESQPHGLAQPAALFLAGVLVHLPALMPFLLASPNSYRRAVPSTWSGAYHVRGSTLILILTLTLTLTLTLDLTLTLALTLTLTPSPDKLPTLVSTLP